MPGAVRPATYVICKRFLIKVPFAVLVTSFVTGVFFDKAQTEAHRPCLFKCIDNTEKHRSLL